MTKILVVEDDGLLRRAWARTLGTAQYEVCVAPDAISAVSTAVKERPALVLLDLGLPAGNGTVVLERLRNRVLTKPVTSEQLLGAISDVLHVTRRPVRLRQPAAGRDLRPRPGRRQLDGAGASGRPR